MKRKYIVRVRPESRGREALWRGIAEGGMPPGAEVIYDERNRLARVVADGVPYIVKAFRRPNVVNRWAYVWLRASKAARSFRNALRLEALGVLTPRPEAYMEVRRGGRLHESYYVCREEPYPQIRDWERRPDAASLLPAFAADMARLHRLGVYHKDFSPGNILVGGDAEAGYRFYYIDLNRMAFGEHRPGRLMRMFGRMHTSLERVLELARAYAESAGVPPEEVEKAAARSWHRFWDHRRR